MARVYQKASRTETEMRNGEGGPVGQRCVLWLQVPSSHPYQHGLQWNTGQFNQPVDERLHQPILLAGVNVPPPSPLSPLIESFTIEVQERLQHSTSPTQNCGDEQIISHYLESRVPSEEYINRWGIITRLEKLLKGHVQFNLQYPFATDLMGLFVIGSSKTELGFKSDAGDLDICLMLSHDEVTRSEAIGVLRAVEGVLKAAGWCNVQVITAVVPILIFTDEQTTIVCDLNINNKVGIRNSHLLTCYANFDWRVKPLILFIKKWAKSRSINSARHKTICSYALTLMVIGYLQLGLEYPVLPCLQQAYPQYFTDDIATLAMNLPTFLPFPKDRLNMMSLYDLLLGFFYFYVHQFRFEFDVLSVRRGQILSIEKVKWEQAQQRMSQYGGLHGADMEMDAQTPSYTYDNAYMFIEEPFNRTNVSRSVYDPEVFQRIKIVFKEAYDELTASRNPFSIFN